MARIFSRGIPGLVPPPTERMIPSPPGTLQNFEGLVLHFIGGSANRNFQRIHVAHQAHAVADASFHFSNVPLLAPVEHIESSVRQVVEAGVHFGIIVIKLDPILGKGIADSLQIRMRELEVMLLVRRTRRCRRG